MLCPPPHARCMCAAARMAAASAATAGRLAETARNGGARVAAGRARLFLTVRARWWAGVAPPPGRRSARMCGRPCTQRRAASGVRATGASATARSGSASLPTVIPRSSFSSHPSILVQFSSWQTPWRFLSSGISKEQGLGWESATGFRHGVRRRRRPGNKACARYRCRATRPPVASMAEWSGRVVVT